MMIKKILRIVFIEAPAELYLFWLSYFALGWGVLLFVNKDVLLSSSSYQVFQAFNLEPMTWLLIYAGVGLFGIYSCLVKNKKVIQFAVLLLLMLWSFTVYCFILASGTIGTGSFVYSSFALLSAWTYLRVGNHSFQSALWNG